ncbi:MAG: fibronectin type III domain-containing protein [Armatimonadota bacterium]|nr:fibronectin type III domain-containing protein [bacterium]
MTKVRVFPLYLALVFVIFVSVVCVGSPIINPSFELGVCGLDGWSTYSYIVAGGDGALPVVGCVGESCTFNILSNTTVPDGVNVCGLQSAGAPSEPARNGGIFQSFTWAGGAADIIISGRAYSMAAGEYGYYEHDNGSRVYVGLVGYATSNASNVSSWVELPWGDYEPWQTATLSIYGSGTYTLFIRGYQTSGDTLTTTLWDNVQWCSYNTISNITATVPGDPAQVDSTALISWTTSISSNSQVAYGIYGGTLDQTVSDSALTTNHSVRLENLIPGKKYMFQVTSSADDTYDVSSSTKYFTLPIQFSNVSASTQGLNVVVEWTTDIEATSYVEYWKTSSGASTSTAVDDTLTTAHSVTLSGLDEVETYGYRVWSGAPNCSTRSSGDYQFTTLPVPKSSLENGSFESSATDLYPWVQYTSSLSGCSAIDGLLGPYPSSGTDSWSSAGIKAYDGSYFIGASASIAYKDGGVFQRIYWPAGQICSLCARFATVSVGGGYYDTRARLGIDPNGGTDPSSSSIVWWKGFSPTEDNKWYPGGVTTTAGSTGMVTVFLDIRQYYPILTHIVAMDDVTFGSPAAIEVGALKQQERCTGAQLEDVIVTLAGQTLTYEGMSYNKAYVQRSGSPAGIAVIFGELGYDQPDVGDRVTLKGILMPVGKEAVVNAYDWTVTQGPFALPSPFGMPQCRIGGSAHNQPALYASSSVCNVGSRVRLWGNVTNGYYDGNTGFTVAYIDDGSRLLDYSESTIHGTRVYLVGNNDVKTGDYLAATGVLSIEAIDPDSIPGSDDEYSIYTLITDSQDDWTSIPAD